MSNERRFQTIATTTKISPMSPNSHITIYYGWHPDTHEVVVSIVNGIASDRHEFPELPESQWQTLDFDDPAFVDDLFHSSTEVRDIQKLIADKDSPVGKALLQYLHKIIGEAL